MGGSPGSWLTTDNRSTHLVSLTRSFEFALQSKKKRGWGGHTHTAGRFVPTTSATAAARTGPTPRAPRGSGVAPRETRTPPPPQTEPSGTAPGNTGRAAGSLRSGTLLQDGR